MLNTDHALYSYKAFGLQIASEIPLPELQPYDGPPKVVIKLGRIPDCMDEVTEYNEHHKAGEKKLFFQVKDVGKYYINNGNQIIIEPEDHADGRAIRLFLLGLAMGALLFQRGILPIHGSVISMGEYCFVLTGVQGAGKSTLASAFRKEGYPILTDDVAAIYFDEAGTPYVHPSYPQQKLWKDSLLAIGDPTELFPSIHGRLDKYAVAIPDMFCDTPKKLAAIFEIKPEEGVEVRVTKLSGTSRLTLILNNIYRYDFIKGLGLGIEVFRYSAAIAGKASVFIITRPKGTFTMEKQMELIKKHFGR